jgi:non-specific serine/threonine protein kinase
LVGDARLVTLGGPGGCGKTRLALAVAQEMVESFEGGVWWVELASLSDPKLVPGALASALGVREVADRSPTEVLVEHLETRKTLLVLDNCEHLVEGCAALADALLRACPELEILATSREPLRIGGEAVGMVPSLSFPDPLRLPPAAELANYEAVRLFVERAKAVDVGFALTERNASAVARLCRKLDGIPLAIELAAARVRALTVEQISQRLEDPLGLLTTGSRTAAPRHQTLRAALQWSYELLSEQERELLGRLSVFSGGWDLEAAEAVGAGGPVESRLVLDLLSALVDKSLVVAEEGGEEGASSYLRYRMLEPVRQYAREKLEESAEAPEVLRRHAEYYLALAERAEPELLGPDQGRWFGRLRSEVWNLQGVLSWSLSPAKRRKSAYRSCGCGSWLRCGGSGTCRVSRKANGGYRRCWRGIPEDIRPPGPRRLGAWLYTPLPATLRTSDRRPRRGHRPLQGARGRIGWCVRARARQPRIRRAARRLPRARADLRPRGRSVDDGRPGRPSSRLPAHHPGCSRAGGGRP